MLSGDLPRARDCFSKSLIIFTETKGGAQIETAEVSINLGKLCLREENLQSAKEYLERALEIFSAFFKEDHPKKAEVYLQMGILHSKMRSSSVALAYFEAAKRVF
jgi:tetratricopeptide (TPR) repeat protein